MDARSAKSLDHILGKLPPPPEDWQPLIMPAAAPDTAGRVRELIESQAVRWYTDTLEEAIIDLFKIEFPFVQENQEEYATTLAQYRQEHWSPAHTHAQSVYVYFPWKQHLLRLPQEVLFSRLRTARNRFLITEDEQETYYRGTVGIAGMSIGSSILQALVLTGGCRQLRLADFDTLSITNLNRLPGSVTDLSRSKLYAAARRATELNPFQELTLFPEGLREDGLEDFFNRPRPLEVFVEEMDSIRMKILSRLAARKARIPVVMATDNGDNTIIDVERFDLEPDRPLFHGSVEERLLRDVGESISLNDKVRLANSIVGPDVTPRTQLSLTAVGSELPAWPQLGTAALLSGTATAYVVRRILTGAAMPSGRYEVHLDASLDPSYHSPEATAERAQKKAEFIDGFNLIYGEGIPHE
jgi:hypothetical protein